LDQEREAEGVDEIVIVRIGSGERKAGGRKGGVAELLR